MVRPHGVGHDFSEVKHIISASSISSSHHAKFSKKEEAMAINNNPLQLIDRNVEPIEFDREILGADNVSSPHGDGKLWRNVTVHIYIPTDAIGAVIGKRGSTIARLQLEAEECGCREVVRGELANPKPCINLLSSQATTTNVSAFVLCAL